MGTLFSLSKSATSTALDISEIALLLFGVLLVIGLIGEYAKAERWRKHTRAFEMFVIIGVAGELWADGGIFLFSSHLQTIADLEIAGLTREAGEANDRASKNEREAAELRKEASDARQKAAEANERAVLANERTEKERKARTAMLLQLQPRDFTKKQMDAFVASVKGKVTELNVFTLPDPEAAGYGFEVMEGLQRADVKVAWYPTTSPYFLIPGISSSGLTLYESPGRKVGIPLMEAFLKAGQSMAWFTPERPSDQDRPGVISLSSVPSPALFIALKQPAFSWLPGYRNVPALHAHRPPWDPK